MACIRVFTRTDDEYTDIYEAYLEQYPANGAVEGRNCCYDLTLTQKTRKCDIAQKYAVNMVLSEHVKKHCESSDRQPFSDSSF